MFNTAVKQSIPLNPSRRARATHARPKGIEQGKTTKLAILNKLVQSVEIYTIPFGIVN